LDYYYKDERSTTDSTKNIHQGGGGTRAECKETPREGGDFRARWPCFFYSSSFTDAMPLLYWQTLPPQYHHMMTTTTICLILSFPSFLPSRPPSLKSFSIVL